ncbi:hypothetical protein GmHk_19G054734 [Glycine max]|nr:hypothetical protein GmHk_19G054734 [Glycine max]
MAVGSTALEDGDGSSPTAANDAQMCVVFVSCPLPRSFSLRFKLQPTTWPRHTGFRQADDLMDPITEWNWLVHSITIEPIQSIGSI